MPKRQKTIPVKRAFGLVFGIAALVLLGIVLLSRAATTSDEAPTSMPSSPVVGTAPKSAHPTPSSLASELPADAVVLWDQPEQRMTSANGVLQIYNNSANDMEFRVLVSRSALDRLGEKMAERGATKDTPVRVIVRGLSSSSAGTADLGCEIEYGQRYVELHFDEVARQVDRFDFPRDASHIQRLESQSNLILFHEAAHEQHCRLGVEPAEAEAEAVQIEYDWTAELPRVLFLRGN